MLRIKIVPTTSETALSSSKNLRLSIISSKGYDY